MNYPQETTLTVYLGKPITPNLTRETPNAQRMDDYLGEVWPVIQQYLEVFKFVSIDLKAGKLVFTDFVPGD